MPLTDDSMAGDRARDAADGPRLAARGSRTISHAVPRGARHAPRRPWYRWHISTVFLLLPVIVIWAAILLAGERDTADVEHGWPLIFTTRHRAMSLSDYAVSHGLREAEPKPHLALWNWDGVFVVDRLNLTIDVGVAMLGILAVGLLLEWRRRRVPRLWQVSLRELALLTLVVACGCAWWGSLYRQTRRREATLQALEIVLNRAPVAFGDGTSSTLWFPRAETQWRSKGDWLLECFWTEETKPRWFAEIHTLAIIVEENLADEALELVGQLPALESLRVEVYGGTKRLSDEGIVAIARLRRLQHLTIYRVGAYWDLSSIGLNDAQVARLAELTELRTLDLSRNNVTDAGLDHLHGLKHLEVLGISNNQTTDQGVDRIQQAIPGLMVLDD